MLAPMSSSQFDEFHPDPSLTNDDLKPTTIDQRNFSGWEMASLWIGLVVGVPSYYLAGSLVDLGMSWWQGIAIVVLANLVTLVPLILIGQPGTKFGISFPVLARSSFGIKGAHIPTLLRALVGCGWYGIETWIGGEAIFLLLPKVVKTSSLSQSISWLGTSPLEFACFITFWIAQLAIVWKGIDGIRELEKYSAPILISLTCCLLIWAYVKAGGFGHMLDLSSRITNLEFWSLFFPSLTANIGFWATLALNIPDFTRYAKSQHDQIIGQAGLPIFMGLFTFVGLAVTSSTKVIFGHVISNPITLLGEIGGLLTMVLAIFGISLATITTNIAANVVAPANALVNLSPSWFNFRRGPYFDANATYVSTNKAQKKKGFKLWKQPLAEMQSVPKGWDRLSLSVICVETGKTVAKLGKTLVKSGSCQWPETLLESVWISQDDSSMELEESLYKFVVSMGSARSGLLGEGTINLASYVGSRMSSPVLLPLKKCNHGTTLQASLMIDKSIFSPPTSFLRVKIHCLTPRSKFRDEPNSSHSGMKEHGLDHDVDSKSNESGNFSAGSDVLPYDPGSNPGPSKFEIKDKSFSASGSNDSFSSAESFTRKEKLPSRNHLKNGGSKQVRASPDHTSPQNDQFIDDQTVSNQSSYNTKTRKDFTASSGTNSGSSRNLLEAAEDTIEELRIEAKMWERNARKLMLDLDILREEFTSQSKKQADLVMDLSAAYSEQGTLKREIENLKLMLEKSTEKRDMGEDSIFQPRGQKEELENEIRHQQELNASLALQLKGSQESNIELLSLLQELEETIEQQKVEIEKFSSLHLRLADMAEDSREQDESEESVQRSVQSLKKSLQDKNHELESERRMNRQTENGHSEKASTELVREIEALREKVQELERDCAELTEENLDLLIKFKESGSESTRTPVEKVGEIENSEKSIELVKQLEVAFHNLKRPWNQLSSSVSDQCKHHLENLAILSEDVAISSKLLTTNCVLTNLYDLNNLLETRFVECEECLKQHKQEIQERNRKLEAYSLEVQAHESSKEEQQIQCSGHLKELDQKVSELDKLQAELQRHEEEKSRLLEHQRELEGKVAGLQMERDQVEENMKIISRESAITSSCLDARVSENKLLESKLAQLESEKHTLEDRLVGLTEKNENMEAKIRLMTVEEESRQSELEESRTIIMNLQEEMGKLDSETKTSIADLKEELKDMQILWSQAREECAQLMNENEKLQESLRNLLERKNVEQYELRVQLEAQLHESQKSLSNSLIKVKALEENLNSMWKDFSLKEERMNAELNELIQENKNEIEKLEQQESLSNQKYSEKMMEVERLEKEVEQLMKQISEMDEERRLASDAASEVSSLRADKEKLVSVLEDVQSKFTSTEKELAASRQSYEKLMVDHAKILKLLPNYRAKEEKLKTSINDLELQLTLSRYEHQKLYEESANLKFQLQKTKELKDEVFNLKSKLTKCMSEKEKLEASMEKISGDCEEMKAEKASFAGKMSDLQKVLSDLENSNRKKTFLEEKVEQMESELAEKERFRAQVADLKNELSETKRDNEQYRQKIYKMEEEKDNLLRKVQALEAEVKMMEEEKKLYAKKFEQNDTPKSISKYTNFNRAPQKQELRVDQLHSEVLFLTRLFNFIFKSNTLLGLSKNVGTPVLDPPKEHYVWRIQHAPGSIFDESDQHSRKHNISPLALGENGSTDGIVSSVEADYLARIRLLENKLAEALESNKKYKIQLQRFKTEERRGNSPTSKKLDADSEMVKRFEQTKSLLEAELKDLRERYFQMSLKYAEVEAQREDLVMKLKAVKSGKRWFS
ncbi:Purine-uracil permease NCS1 [Capsicum chinense]|nr:Purine-uracil permease NCS1 [Capsicum chinense]